MARLYGEPHIECNICGFELPLSHAVRHYKTKKLVDRKCADEIGAYELRALTRIRSEDGANSPQPVSGQGEDGVNSGFGISPFGESPFGDPTT